MEPAEAPVSMSATVVPPRAVRFNFDNTYARLDARFHARVAPMPVAAPQLIKINAEVADKLGLDPEALATSEGVQILAGNRVPEGGEPLGQAYAGHQFGSFVPQLGDGRANLMGEVLGRDGVRYDIQLKGSGRTPFSRGGDGRAALGPVLREYLVSEAMAALGVPTTRALAAVTTGETVLREAALPGAVLTRVAASHLRVGTFQYFAAREDTEALRILADYAIARHDPQAASAEQPYRAFLDGVITRQARLVAQWMSFGFIHGVMNTDNSSISGETIDYGPCAFMEAYDPAAVFSFIDRQGRYAFANQPRIALWNLTRLAESLLPLLAERAGDGSVADRAGDAAERADQAALASATEALSAFAPQFEAAYTEAFRRKLGLFTPQPEDAALIQDLLERMASSRADFTRTFRLLGDAVLAQGNDAAVRALFADPAGFDAWAARWHQRLHLEKVSAEDRAASMRRANPVFIPRNHLVEAVIQAAVQRRDFQPFETLLDLITHPHADRPGFESYAAPARPEERVEHTFCGT